jgi:L-lysine 2,3-aminomutase
LLDVVEGFPKTIVVVHVNHANEIDEDVSQAIRRLQGSGVILLNQSVLLGGVNDTIEALVELSESLIEASVLPYYLHLLDRVHGAAHFDVSDDKACHLVASMRARLPGYLVPRLVREVEGAPSKVPMLLGKGS